MDQTKTIMAQNNVKSNIEWLSSLSPTKAAVPTEDTKFLRKVSRKIVFGCSTQANAVAHRNVARRRPSLQRSVSSILIAVRWRSKMLSELLALNRA